jgi:hypothetical protein
MSTLTAGGIMQDFTKRVERAARMIFKQIFGMRLYRLKESALRDDLFGVHLNIGDGNNLSLVMERDTAQTITEHLTGNSGDEYAYDVIGEIANMIAGKIAREVSISVPEKLGEITAELKFTLNFRSPVGEFSIALTDR